jgi:NAD(P)-dependent dehydrogenase (short-subunit alcohol dehydrogenase family)
MNDRLKNKIIIVTGGNGLLGRAIVDRIKLEGAFCVNLEINHKTNEDLSNIECDITSQESVDNALRIILNKYNRIDGLVNNAYPRTADWGNKFEDIEFHSWSKNVDIQMNSVFYICQKVLAQMKSQNSGSIINMGSIYGVVGNDFTIYEGTKLTSAAAYSAIKGGIINFTRYLASYFGKYNIRANCVSPGGIFDNQNEVFVKNYEHKVPMKRMGSPDDIAPSIAFLLSDDSKYITGQNLIIDGGWTII